MSELAFNINGDPFEVSPSAVAWRARKMKAKGAPEVAYGRNGLPLVLPIEADVDDVRAEVSSPGRYRLDQIDAASKLIEGAPAGYVYVHELLSPAPEVPQAIAPSGIGLAPLPAASDNVVIEALRMNAEIARLVVGRFPDVVEASASLLRAADGAGLPARPGMVIEDDDDDDDDDEDDRDEQRGGGFDIGALLQQAAPLLQAFTSGKLRISDILNWNKAAEKGAAARQQPTSTPASVPEPEVSIEDQLRSDPAAGMHFMAIMSGLTPDEALVARTMAREMSSKDRTTWFGILKSMSVPDATAKVRAELERLGKEGGAS